jgi:DnaJ family protein C protein 11
MADAASARLSGGGSSRARRNRGQPGQGGGSRNSSARSSAVYNDDYLQAQHQGYGSSMGLRSTASRFSLNEQFAATRREIDFGFDDSSSILERATLASEAIEEDAGDDTVVIGPLAHATGYNTSSALQEAPARDFYDLLCLPRDPSADTIRRAYFRLFVLLYPETHPPKLRGLADVYFALVHTAFETLIDPVRRFEYDLGHADTSTFSHGDECRYPRSRLWHNEVLRHRLLYAGGDDDDHGSLELGLKLNIEGLSRPSGPSAQRGKPLVKPLDFAMSQTLTTSVPALGQALDRLDRHAQGLFNSSSWGNRSDTKELVPIEDILRRAGSGRTLLSVKGSIYGFLQDLVSIPVSIIADPYKPSIPTYIPRERALQLLDGRVRPLVTVKVQHEFLPSRVAKDESEELPASLYEPGAVVELSADILPDPSLAIGVTKHVTLPRDNTTSIVQIAAKSSLWHTGMPRLGATVQRPTAGGLLQCKVESGDWVVKPDETCYAFTQFSKINRRFLSLDVPIRMAPQMELAYKMHSSFRRPAACISERSPERGLHGLDWEIDHDSRNDGQGSWTVSTTAEPNCLGASVKYAIDANQLLLPLSRSLSRDSTSQQRRVSGRGIRLEAELSSTSLWARFLGLRCLKRVGRFSKFGFEVGLSTYNLHLSLYWSRLGQRVRVPFFICSGSSISSRVLFWTTLVPFASFAAWELLAYRNRVNTDRRLEQERGKAVQRRQVEADEVTLLLSANVESRQDSERANRGLVILSAKYGVKGDGSWGAEEVADVTTALAATVDNSQLLIPHGVLKSNMLGFWDPAPGVVKTLHVRFLCHGKEGMVEVHGEEELRLPPADFV